MVYTSNHIYLITLVGLAMKVSEHMSNGQRITVAQMAERVAHVMTTKLSALAGGLSSKKAKSYYYILTGYWVLGIVYLDQLSGARHTHISYHNMGKT